MSFPEDFDPSEPEFIGPRECRECTGHPWTICGNCGRTGRLTQKELEEMDASDLDLLKTELMSVGDRIHKVDECLYVGTARVYDPHGNDFTMKVPTK